ncbi:MAG: hypothetical protein RI953_2038 [Pseudomonadota bacterium]|jgi:hypothetical protein
MMTRTSRNGANQAAAQSSSLLLGLALTVSVCQSALLCQTGALSGFGWALLASLAGCFYATISQWNELIQTLTPEQATWKRAIIAGFFLAIALFLFGHSMTQKAWNPFDLLSLCFIPLSRTIWRKLFVGDTLQEPIERGSAILMLMAAGLFLFPDLNKILHVLRPDENKGFYLIPFKDLQGIQLPRSLALLAAMLFGAASSLQRPQDRSISSRTFWTIPTAISAILLSTTGWIALHVLGSRDSVMGNFENFPVHKAVALIPAMLSGVVLLALRPQLHIRNSLRIGRLSTHWWQALGSFTGIAVSLALLDESVITGLDFAALTSLMLGQYFALRQQPPTIQFARPLASVPMLEPEKSLLSSQNS